MFEWDEQKAIANVAKHGIRFEEAARAFFGLTLTSESRRGDELRFTTIAQAHEELIVIVRTPRQGVVRLISARRAARHEQRAYRQAVLRGAGTG
jgi:uncharacterized DUF497 family protein